MKLKEDVSVDDNLNDKLVPEDALDHIDRRILLRLFAHLTDRGWLNIC